MRKGGEIMTKAMNRLNSIPTYVIKELGLNEDWKDNISPKQQKIATKLALKYKKALKKLSKS